jgi:hypothetical protein
MLGKRAIAVLGSLQQNHPSFDVAEIEELLKAKLAVEADPRDVAMLEWLAPLVEEHAKTPIGDAMAPANLLQACTELDTKLKSDWYRFRTGDAKLRVQEQQRIQLRRALGVVNDKRAYDHLLEVLALIRSLPAGARLTACQPIGDELYAITARGVTVRHQLDIRATRFAEAPLADFLKAYDKVTTKMQTFGGEVRTIAKGIGHVPKNPHQVVIGLVKSGRADAVDQYRNAIKSAQAPDVAVTQVRNLGETGGTKAVADRLKQARSALHKAGLPHSEVVDGAAKTLLAFESLDVAANQLHALYAGIHAQHSSRDASVKIAARLMPASGSVEDKLARFERAHAKLPGATQNRAMLAGALAASAPSVDKVDDVVERWRALYKELANRRISDMQHAATDALECLGCPGTAPEVVATVETLLAQVAQGREPTRGDVAIAVSFAKRFSF